MTAAPRAAADDDEWLRALQEELGMICTVCNRATAATHVICGRCPTCRTQPKRTACSPWCLVDYADTDPRNWKHCTHRRRTT